MTLPKTTYPDHELLRLVPRVLRARDFHLYTEGGKGQSQRLTDLWLQGGRAILGHKPSGVVRELKNAAERGLFVSLPHPMEKRFFKALEILFPGRAFRLYPDEGALYRALEEAGLATVEARVPNGKACIPQGEVYANVCLWRPFEMEPEKVSLGPKVGAILPFFIPVLPWPLGPAVLVLEKNLDTSFPPGGIIPPVLLAPAIRSLYDLIAAIKNKKMNRGNPRYPKIDKVFTKPKTRGKEPADSTGDLPGGSIWRRRGIYLNVDGNIEKEKYAALFRLFLEGGFLIPPSPLEPMILPASMSPGEESKLADLLVKSAECSGAISP